MFRFTQRPLIRAALLTTLWTAQAACASSLLLDDFAAPVPVVGIVAPSQNFVTSQAGTYAGVAGQNRAAYYFPYYSSSAAAPAGTATVGGGAVQVAATVASIGEVQLGYGAYGAPASNLTANGPFLHLDLSGSDDLRLSFSSLAKQLNVVIGFYTSTPAPGSGSLYYLDAEVDLMPAADGGPVSRDVLFKGADAFTPPALFNFSQVDGMVVIFDRASATEGNSYSLNSLSFTQAVPEPESAALLFAGLLFVGLRGSRVSHRTSTRSTS